jgi:hypothetical protein
MQLPSLETTPPTGWDVVESRAPGNTASRVAQKIRAIRLAGKKKVHKAGIGWSGGAQVSLVDSSEAETRGFRGEFGGWRMGFNGLLVTHGVAVIVQPIESISAAF